MIIGVPKEIKDNEFRVSLTPGGAYQLVREGHQVLVERHAGEGSGFTDSEYAETGAKLIDQPPTCGQVRNDHEVKSLCR